jgi:hypothetical protein
MNSSQLFRRANAPYPDPQQLPGLREAKLAEPVPGYSDLSISSQGMQAGPASHNVETALAELEGHGTTQDQDAVRAAAIAIANTHPPDRYSRVTELAIRYKIDRQPITTALGATPLPPRPPVRNILHKAGNFVRATSHKAQTLVHHSHYKVPPKSALAFLAGAYGRPVLFRMAVNEADIPDFSVIAKNLNNAPFFDANCLRSVVESAASEGAVGDQLMAPDMVEKAHHLIALYLRSRRTSDFQAHAVDLFSLIAETVHGSMPKPAPNEMDDFSRYFGVLMGLCIGGTLRYGQMEQADRTKHRERIILAINAVAGAIGAASFPGVGTLTTGISSMAQPIADKIVRDNNIQEETMQLSGRLEARLLAQNGPGFNAQACFDKLRITIHQCGYNF